MSTIGEIPSEEVLSETIDLDRESEASFVSKAIDAFATPFVATFNYVMPKNPVTDSREFWYIPKPVENLIGRVMYPIMKLGQGGATEHFYSETCREIMKNLAAHSRRDLPYEVTVLNSNVVNAWCLPGGKVAVHKLLLEKIDYYVSNKEAMKLTGYTHPKTGEVISYENVTKEDVIAALLGHEMTHADARHSARKLELSFAIQLLVFGASFYVQGKLSKAKAEATSTEELEQVEALQKIHKAIFGPLVKLGTMFYFLAGSRSHELEADKYGTHLAVEAGYDAAGALFLQEILRLESKGIHSFLPEVIQKIQNLFVTHPSCSDRQLALFEDVKNYTQK